jgi:hypothetical protein
MAWTCGIACVCVCVGKGAQEGGDSLQHLQRGLEILKQALQKQLASAD